MKWTIDFLNLISDFGDDWVIKDIEANYKTQELIIDIEHSGDKYFDPDTEEEVSLYDHAPKRIWRHLDIWEFKTFVRCSVPRVLCKDGKVKTIRCGWSGPHDRHTYSFEIKVINTLQATKNQTKTAELMNCSFRLVNRIMHLSSERGMSRREMKSYQFDHLSIDEKSFKKGHKYVTVVSDPISGSVLDICEGRNYESVKGLIDSMLSKEQQQSVRTISMDMWKAYIKIANILLPNAEIVHDRFHLIKYLNEAIDKVRKREVKQNEVLINSRYSLLKNEENRTEKQDIIFETIMQSNLEVTKAYYAKETFKTMFGTHNNDELANHNLIAWASKFYMYNIKELNAVILRMLSHAKGVTNALISSWNNAMAERLNGKIQEIKVSGRGYRTFSKFRSAILFFHGNLNLYPLKW